MISSQPAGFMPDSWSVNSRPEPLVAEAEIALIDTRSGCRISPRRAGRGR
jgi:hypothetical protein